MKICFIHPWVSDIESFLKVTFLKGRIDSSQLEWSDTEPDILFATEWIYYRSDMFRRFADLYGKAGIKVGYLAEAIDPDWNLFDYGVGFSDRYPHDERFIRILSPVDMYRNFITADSNEIKTPSEALELLPGRTGFCNFLYSNPKAHPMRDRLFYQISKYKRVDSLGKHLCNVSTPGTGYGSGHAGQCADIKSRYKFSISSENASFCGYTSEKCFTSLIAHTVPIYWGNPHIKDDINPDAFINVPDFPSLDAVIGRIKEIDSDDSLWAGIVSAPWRTADQVAAQAARTEAYFSRMAELLAGGLPCTVPAGYHPDMYKGNAMRGDFPFDRSFMDKLASRVKSLVNK